jgi:hypothetical protein
MAKILPGPMIAEARGSVGGTTFSRNRYGLYTRNKSSPVQPNTERQQSVRANFTLAAQRWRDTLTDAQREAWRDYALGSPIVDSLGLSQVLAGNAMYIRFNSVWLAEEGGAIDAAPTTPGLGPKIDPTITGDTVNGIQLTAFVPAAANDRILVLTNDAPTAQSRDFFKGPFTFRAWITTAVALPWVFVLPAELAVGQRWFVAFRLFTDDGRVGDRTIVHVDITA